MDSRVTWAIQEIEERMGEPLTVAALAASLNLSPSRFAHLFRAELGVPPMRYLHTRRMLRARALLESTFSTVKQVMVQVGCNDPSHFARDFRRFHGKAPSDCRLEILGGPRNRSPGERRPVAGPALSG